MATVTGKTSAKIDELLSTGLVSGELDEEGQLTLTTRGGVIINAGSVSSSIVSAVVNVVGHLILTRRNGTEVDAGAVGSLPIDAWPVGSIYFGTSPTNPATLLGGGTWVIWGKGKVVVGVDSADTAFDSVEKAGGSKTNSLVLANLPDHTHSITHTHNLQSRASTGSIASLVAQGGGGTTQDDSAVDGYSGQSGSSTGSASPVNNLQPYITCYIWKRSS